MPPVVLLAVVGAGCYAGYKLFSKLIEQAQTPDRTERERAANARASEAARHSGGPARDLGELEWDEKSGVYRPKSRV